MIHLFFNALAASAGAGPTYVRNIVPQISARSDVRATIALSPPLGHEFANSSNVTILAVEAMGVASRYWREQTVLPRLIRSAGADVLVSTGNFALRKSPVPQILLSGNSLYLSKDFDHDVLSRRDYAAWLDTRIKSIFARRSIVWADATVAPSRSFARALSQWAGHHVTNIYHGFNRDAFFADPTPLPAEVQQKINSAECALKLLFVSHYNYYRNFETLLRAIPLIRERLRPRPVRLFLTCDLHSETNPGAYRAERSAALVQDLHIKEEVVELGAIAYPQLHHLYSAADIYVTPAYAETFAHPLVEAMASGLALVASDIPVHREICGESAIFFDRFSPMELAKGVIQVASSPDLAQQLRHNAKERIKEFSWQRHLDQIVKLSSSLLDSRASR